MQGSDYDEQALEAFYLDKGLSHFGLSMIIIGTHLFAIWLHYLN